MTESTLFMVWFAGGVLLMLLEFIVPGGIVFFLGLGALLVALLSQLGLVDGWVNAFTVWFVGSLALLFGLRGVVQKIVPAEVDKANTNEDLDAYDQPAEVCETIPAGGEGRIAFRGSTWPAANVHGDRELPASTPVRIVFRDNLVWMVEATGEGEGDSNRKQQS